MPDLLPGSIVKAADTPPTETDVQTASFTFDSTTYGVDADGGTYNDCAVAFIAPTTGRVKIDYAASLDNSTSASTSVTPVVREGSVIGSGTVIHAADIAYSVLNIGTDQRRYGAHITLENLTPGAAYNVRLEHRVSGGIGTILGRVVTAAPCT